MNEENSEIEINLMDEIKFIFKSKLQLFCFALVFSFLAGAYSYTLPREYSSKVTFMPSESNVQAGSQSSIGGLVGLVGLNRNSGPTQTSIALAVLNSRSFLNYFSEKHGITQFLYPDAWDQDNKKWKKQSPNQKDIAIKLRNMFSVEGTQQDIYELEFEWTNSYQAALWANSLINELDSHIKDQKIESGILKISFLNDQLGKNRLNDIDNVFFKMIEGQITKNMLANVSDGYVFKVLDQAIEATSNHKPKRLQLVFLGFFLGIFIGIFYSYIFRSHLRSK